MPETNIDLKSILKLLLTSKPDKAPGPDLIKPIIRQELGEEILPVIQLLFQKSISTGKIPSDRTKANVSQLFKNCISDPVNYRPISLTCVLCKTMKQITPIDSHKGSSMFKVIRQMSPYGYQGAIIRLSSLNILISILFSMIFIMVLEKGDHVKLNLFSLITTWAGN